MNVAMQNAWQSLTSTGEPATNWDGTQDALGKKDNGQTEALFHDVLAIQDQLLQDSARTYGRQLQRLLQRHLTLGHQLIEFERLPQGEIDDRPRATKKAIPTAVQRLQIRDRRKARQAARAARDDEILEGRRQANEVETQASIGSHITVVPRSQIYNLTSSEASDSESIDTEPLEEIEVSRSQSEPPPPPPLPASTAPPRF